MEDKRLTCMFPAALAKAKQEALDSLPAEYYQQEYDSVAGELALLPRMFTEADLDSVVEERSGVLEVCALRVPVLLARDQAHIKRQIKRLNPVNWLCQPGTAQMEL